MLLPSRETVFAVEQYLLCMRNARVFLAPNGPYMRLRSWLIITGGPLKS